MATAKATVAYICEQVQGAGVIAARPMFGEYGLYCDGKMVGLICDDQLFLKPTPQAMAILGPVPMAPAYSGGKPMALAVEALDDADLMARVVAMIASEVPEPKPKKPKTAKGKT
jgi:TfoX/Sxy family transcriptional regulator of competence genes